MANRWLVQNLIDNAKRRGLVVLSDDSAEGFTTADFLALIDDVIRSKMLPLLKRARESYLVKRYDVDIAEGAESVPIPGRAAAEALHSILVYTGEKWVPLERYGVNAAAERFSTSLAGYWLEDDTVFFVGSPAAQTLRFLVFTRPNLVVEATAVAEITDVDFDTQEVTTATMPDTFTSDSLFDFVKGSPGFRNHAVDLTGTIGASPGAGLSLITMDDELPENLAVGDYLCLAGESPIAQIPAELHPLLAQEVTRTLLEAKGDPKADRAAATVERMEREALDMLSPRVSASPEYVLNANSPGWRRRRLGQRWR